MIMFEDTTLLFSDPSGTAEFSYFQYSWTPLLVALQGGHLEVAQEILKTTPNTNTTDKVCATVSD